MTGAWHDLFIKQEQNGSRNPALHNIQQKK